MHERISETLDIDLIKKVTCSSKLGVSFLKKWWKKKGKKIGGDK